MGGGGSHHTYGGQAGGTHPTGVNAFLVGIIVIQLKSLGTHLLVMARLSCCFRLVLTDP